MGATHACQSTDHFWRSTQLSGQGSALTTPAEISAVCPHRIDGKDLVSCLEFQSLRHAGLLRLEQQAELFDCRTLRFKPCHDCDLLRSYLNTSH